MPTEPVIEDKIVIAKSNNKYGEAPTIVVQSMSTIERQDMVDRLEASMINLMDEAEKYYTANCHKKGTNDVDPNYIMRLSTHEFFFYTKEPLTLKEFEDLQNKIAEKAKLLPQGVQLILSSFAVMTDDKKVMNVTPHITCGEHPDFNFLVKNFTSPVDVRYKMLDANGTSTALDALDFNPSTPKPVLPTIKINETLRDFTFNNVVHCKTPEGTSFLTAVDICLDHYYAVAKNNIIALVKARPEILTQPISHVIVSNSIPIIPGNSLGNVIHADPYFSSIKPNVSKSDVGITFGDKIFTITHQSPQQVDYTYIKELPIAEVLALIEEEKISGAEAVKAFSDNEEIFIASYLRCKSKNENPSSVLRNTSTSLVLYLLMDKRISLDDAKKAFKPEENPEMAKNISELEALEISEIKTECNQKISDIKKEAQFWGHEFMGIVCDNMQESINNMDDLTLLQKLNHKCTHYVDAFNSEEMQLLKKQVDDLEKTTKNFFGRNKPLSKANVDKARNIRMAVSDIDILKITDAIYNEKNTIFAEVRNKLPQTDINKKIQSDMKKMLTDLHHKENDEQSVFTKKNP